MVLLAVDDTLRVPTANCEKCGRGDGLSKCESFLKPKQQTLTLCFCNSLVRKRRENKRRNTIVEKSQYIQNQQGSNSARRTSLPARISNMGTIDSKIEGNQTPIPHRQLLGDPRSPTTGIERTPIAVEKAMGQSPITCDTELSSTPVNGHFLEDPRSPNCPRTPIPLSDPRSPCETVSRTPIFVKPSSGEELDKTEKFVFGTKETSPPKIETTEETTDTVEPSRENNKKIESLVLDEVTECLKQISTPEYDEELSVLVRSTKQDIIYIDEETDTKDVQKKAAKSNRPNLKKIQKKKIQEISHSQQRSPLATRNHHSDSPVVTNKTRTYVRFDHSGGDFRKRQNSLGSTGTRLSAKFEIFTEKENV